jgi:hypothetical protein
MALLTIEADTAVLVGDLHGDLRALAVVLKESGCFRIADDRPGGEHAAWRTLDAACSACPEGRGRRPFPEAALLRSVRYAWPDAPRHAVVFCGDIIDNRRPGVRDGKDEGYGICAYPDSVELVIETVARLCAESPRGAVTWLLGNHDVWPFMPEQSQCRQYAPLHQCEAGGRYTRAFRRLLIEALHRAHAQALVSVNGVVCCHGGLSVGWVQTLVGSAQSVAPCEPELAASVMTGLLCTANRAFSELLAAARAAPDALLPADLGPMAWLLRDDGPLWCRPSSRPDSFARLFDDASFEGRWGGLAAALRRHAFCVAHTMQPRGVTIAETGDRGATVARPRPVREDEKRQLRGGELIYVDTGMSRGFGRTRRVVQIVRVDRSGVLRVTRNLVASPRASPRRRRK